MKLKRINLILSLITSLLVACGGDGIEKSEKKARVVVLCDASNSITQLSSTTRNPGIEILKFYIKDIPDWYKHPFGSAIYYYPVSGNLVSASLGGEVSYNIAFQSDLEPEKERVDALTTKIAMSIDSLANNTSNSCILLSIKRGITRLQELASDTSEYINELIVISDLLESCKSSDTTQINMSIVDAERLNTALKIFDNENPGLNASNLDLHVRLIITSPWMGSGLEAIRKSWIEWFKKAGVKEENIIINTDKPTIPHNPLLGNHIN